MGCFSCFKCSASEEDRFELDTDRAIDVSRFEAEIQEAKRVSLAFQESSLLQKEDEERRQRASELEKEKEERAKAVERREKRKQVEEQVKRDEQLAFSIQQESSRLLRHKEEEEERQRRRASEFEKGKRVAFQVKGERERLIALEVGEEEQLAWAFDESLKEKNKRHQFEEQVKRDKQLQESSRFLRQKEEEERRRRANEIEMDKLKAFQVKERERMMKIISDQKLIEDERQRKQLEEEQVKKDEQFARTVHESMNMTETPPHMDVYKKLAKEKGKGKKYENENLLHDSVNTMVESRLPQLEGKEKNNISTSASLDEDEQRIIWESLKKGKGQIKQSEDEFEEDGNLPEVNPPLSLCGGCNYEVADGRSLKVLGVLWHPECFGCRACDRPITISDVQKHVSNSRGTFHKHCYERYCYVCKERKMRTYNHHPFWEERYCQAHEADGTHKCCSCERLEPWGTDYVMLGDGRWLCLECMESSLMDSDECQPLHFDMRDFFEGLNMKINKEFPFLLVEKQALNKAEKEENIQDYQHEVMTRGICLSEAQAIESVSKGTQIRPDRKTIDMVTETQNVSGIEVTAILILYGLPRLLTGYILAHEMMHAYLRLNGHKTLNKVNEEGLCQVLGHMWLETQRYAPIDEAAASSSSSSSSTIPAAVASKKGDCSEFEKRFVDFCKNQIETDESQVYGVGFRRINTIVTASSLHETLKEIIRRG